MACIKVTGIATIKEKYGEQCLIWVVFSFKQLTNNYTICWNMSLLFPGGWAEVCGIVGDASYRSLSRVRYWFLGSCYISIDKDFQHQIFTIVINSRLQAMYIYMWYGSVHSCHQWQRNSLTDLNPSSMNHLLISFNHCGGQA